jgi:hypothetical protein
MLQSTICTCVGYQSSVSQNMHLVSLLIFPGAFFVIHTLKTGRIMVWRCPSVRHTHDNDSFHSFFSVMVHWIQMIFGIQTYHEEMQVNFEYKCCTIIIGEVIALGRRKLLENDSFRSFSQWWLDGFKACLVYRCIMKRCRSSSNMLEPAQSFHVVYAILLSLLVSKRQKDW